MNYQPLSMHTNSNTRDFVSYDYEHMSDAGLEKSR